MSWGHGIDWQDRKDTMKLGKFFLLMGFITLLALTYIHMQMQIYDLAYQGNHKEQQIRRLIEENGDANYRILMMKSANNLGATMLDEKFGMQFADADDVIQITTSKEFLLEGRFGQNDELVNSTSPLVSLLSFGVTAEAKTSE